ncbi:hypothetical protein AQJ58_20235 [Streptomyces sp. DSM 15324]|nr:hypothetical protein AQJ58_20235 [Streptomyces sp. DSM 15324]
MIVATALRNSLGFPDQTVEEVFSSLDTWVGPLMFGASVLSTSVGSARRVDGGFENPIQRFARDARVLATHGALRLDPMAEINGREVLRLPPFPLIAAMQEAGAPGGPGGPGGFPGGSAGPGGLGFPGGPGAPAGPTDPVGR